MTLRTPICDLFDTEVPVFLTGMGGRRLRRGLRGGIDGVKPAAEIVEQVMRAARETIERLAKLGR